jgi:type I restriction enzyme S subunit
MLPVVLSNYINSTVLKEQLRSMAKGAVNQANINAQELQSIPIYLPPIDLQHEFVAFVEQTDKSKFEIQQSLEKLEILKKSLMQQYFG